MTQYNDRNKMNTNDKTNQLGLVELVSTLNDEHMINAEQSREVEDCVVNTKEEKMALPLYATIFIAIGIFIVSVFSVCGFNILISSTTTIAYKIISALTFVLFAIFLRFKGRNSQNSSTDMVLTHISLWLMWIGKIILFVEFAPKSLPALDLFEHTLILAVLTFGTYYLYDVSCDRFLSVFMFIFFFVITIFKIHEAALPNITKEIVIYTLLFIEIIIAFILFMKANSNRRYIPAAYALVFNIYIGIIAGATITAVNVINKFIPEVSILYYRFYTYFISLVCLIWLIWLIARYTKKMKIGVLITICTFVIIASLEVIPPVYVFSICLILLSYMIQEKPLRIIGIIFMIMLIPIYYIGLSYNTSIFHYIDLQNIDEHKDLLIWGFYTLIIFSGIAMLLVRAFILKKGADKVKTEKPAISYTKDVVLVATTLIILGVFNYSVHTKNTIMQNQELVFVPVSVSVRSAGVFDATAKLTYNLCNSSVCKAEKTHGEIVISLNEKNIAEFSRFYNNGYELKENEKLLQYKVLYSNPFFVPNDQQMIVLPDTFSYKGNHEEELKEIQYAALKFDPKDSSNYILFGLAGNDMKVVEMQEYLKKPDEKSAKKSNEDKK